MQVTAGNLRLGSGSKLICSAALLKACTQGTLLWCMQRYALSCTGSVRRYIDDVRRGRGQSGKQYSARYICSLVADFHRCAPKGSAARSPAALRGRECLCWQCVAWCICCFQSPPSKAFWRPSPTLCM